MKNSTAGLLRVQGLYIFVISVWALFDINSFMQVTGHKTDLWLMRTFSLMMIALSLSFVHAAGTRSISSSILLLAFSSAVVLLGIDIYYSSRGTIPRIYLADGFSQLVFAFCWIRIFALMAWKKFMERLKEKGTQPAEEVALKKEHSPVEP